MKLLMIFAERFAWNPGDRSLDDVPEVTAGAEVENALVGLIHAEAGDVDASGKVETRLIKNLKWGARKNDTQRIILHSFSHLAETKADAGFTRDLLLRAEQRLVAAGYLVWQTPFGYFHDLDLQAPGRSTARIFASF